MFDHRTEDRQATLIAGLILVILLAAVAAFASPVRSAVGLRQSQCWSMRCAAETAAPQNSP